MKCEVLNRGENFDRTVLVADVGGTNVNFGLMGFCEGDCTIIAKGKEKSTAVSNFTESIARFVGRLMETGLHIAPERCCIAAAGPVSENSCKLTNQNWHIDGGEIQDFLGMETTVINDFIAVSRGIPFLDHASPGSIVPVPHSDGYTGCPDPSGVKLVIGPGTGLGVSYMVPGGGSYIPFPSEGGHSDFAAFDEETTRLKTFVTNNTLVKPGIEPFLSGPGIVNIFKFLNRARNFPADEGYAAVMAAPDGEKAELISAYGEKSAVCRETMRLFARILGHVAGSFSAIFLPSGGVYIAGGIAAKNMDCIIGRGHFMACFEQSYNRAMREFLKTAPVYIVTDYSVSLYGAAAAAVEYGVGLNPRPHIPQERGRSVQ
jgi:glucokinase